MVHSVAFARVHCNFATAFRVPGTPTKRKGTSGFIARGSTRRRPEGIGWRMKTKNRDAIRHVIFLMAVCGLAAVGFDYIMETLTARESHPQRTSGHRGTTGVRADR